MTNKEILTKLFDRCMPCIMSLTSDQENRIIRDLEILEILKRIDWLVYNNGDKNDFNWYIDTNKSMKLTKEEAGRLKGWLNDN